MHEEELEQAIRSLLPDDGASLVFREITMQRFLKEPGLDIARIFPATLPLTWCYPLAKPGSAFRRDHVFSLGHRS